MGNEPDTQARTAFTERGASSLEFVLVFAVFLTALMMTVHFAFLFAASEAVDDAAAEVLEAMTLDGSSADPQTVAMQVLGNESSIVPGSVVASPSFTSVNDLTVVVTARAHQIMPGLPVTVRSEVTGFRDRFISESDRR